MKNLIVTFIFAKHHLAVVLYKQKLGFCLHSLITKKLDAFLCNPSINGQFMTGRSRRSSTNMNRLKTRSLHCALRQLRSNGRLWLRNFSAPAKENATEEEEEEGAITIDQRKLPADYNPATFDPTEHRRPPTDRVFRLVDEVAGLTLLEVSDLTELIMKKLGIKDKPVMGMMMPGALMPGMPTKPGGSAVKEEKKPAKTSFDLKLDSYEAASKIKIIKEVRTFTDLGLKEAKELVEKTPALLKRGVSKEEGMSLNNATSWAVQWCTSLSTLFLQQVKQLMADGRPNVVCSLSIWHLASTSLRCVACLNKVHNNNIPDPCARLSGKVYLPHAIQETAYGSM